MRETYLESRFLPQINQDIKRTWEEVCLIPRELEIIQEGVIIPWFLPIPHFRAANPVSLSHTCKTFLFWNDYRHTGSWKGSTDACSGPAVQHQAQNLMLVLWGGVSTTFCAIISSPVVPVTTTVKMQNSPGTSWCQHFTSLSKVWHYIQSMYDIQSMQSRVWQ